MKTLSLIRAFAMISGVAAAFPAFGLEIISREQWGAKPAIEFRDPEIKIVTSGPNRVKAENRMPKSDPPVYLTVHHEAVPIRKKILIEKKLQNLQSTEQNGGVVDHGKYKQRNYLGDIPYHFYVHWNGQVAELRETRFAPWSDTTYTTPISEHIIIVVQGNFEQEKPTEQQLSALIALLEHLANKYKIKLDNISYHKKVASPKTPTLCPGKNLISKMEYIKAELKQRGIN